MTVTVIERRGWPGRWRAGWLERCGSGRLVGSLLVHQEGLDLLELEDRLLVVLVAPDVEPVAVVDVGAHLHVRLEQALHEVGQVEALVGLDVLERRGLDDVDAHADDVRELGLLLEAGDHAGLAGVAVEVDHAVLGAHHAAVGGDREDVAALAVDVHQVRVVERGEHVAVHHQEGVVEAVDGRQRADGAERLDLLVVVDAHAVRGAVAHDGAHEVREVADRQRQVVEAGVAELVHHHVEDGAVADRQQRLRQDRGVRPEPRPLAAGENDCAPTHSSIPFRRSATRLESWIGGRPGHRPSILGCKTSRSGCRASAPWS